MRSLSVYRIRNFLLVGVGAACAQIFAQDNSIIDNLREKYGTGSSLEIVFEQDIFWKVREKHERKSGTLLLSNQDKFRLRIGSTEWVSDGRTCWQYTEQTAQVVIKNLLDIDLSLHPSQLMKTYLSYPYTQETSSGKEALFVYKTPADDEKNPYKEIKVWVDRAENSVKRLFVVDKNGNEITYTFKKTKNQVAFPKDMFTFDIPKGVEVLDTRN